ncbi:MAG: cytochrome c [Gammaproteobacteria bacterium]|nr:MAG: cytochrome c [Gammaproteobacteria bacterium]
MNLTNRLLKTSLLLATLLISSSGLADPTSDRQQQLLHLLKHDCGSCHGMTLKGGLGPSLLPESLKDKPDELLFITIREGRQGTPMPPWKSQLSDDDVQWIIQQLRHGLD